MLKFIANLTINILSIAIFLIFFVSGVSALGTPGYGWGHPEILGEVGSQNTVVINFFSAQNGQPLVPDSFSAYGYILEPSCCQLVTSNSCSGNCSTSLSLTGIPSNLTERISFLFSGSKSGYSSIWDAGSFSMCYGYPCFNGQTVAKNDVYFTLSGIPPRTEFIYPQESPVTYNQPITNSINRIYPSFGQTQANVWYYTLDPSLNRLTLVSLGPYNGPFSQDITLPVYRSTDGWNSLQLIVHDEVDNRSSRSRMYYVYDSTPPYINLDVDPIGSTSNSAVTIILNSYDLISNVGANEIEVSINGGPFGNTNLPSIPQNSLTDYTFTYAIDPGNTYQFRFRSRDDSIDPNTGQQNQWSLYEYSGVVNVVGDSTPPTVSWSFPLGGCFVPDDKQQSGANLSKLWSNYQPIQVSATDNESGIDTVTLRLRNDVYPGITPTIILDKNYIMVFNSTSGFYEYSIPPSDLYINYPNNFYKLSVQALDNAGNNSFEYSSFFKTDGTCKCAYISTKEGDVHSNQNIDISCN